VIVHGVDFRPGPDPEQVEFDDAGGVVRLPHVLPLAPEQVPGWRREFERMHEAFREPTPANRLRVRAGVIRVVAALLDAAAATPPTVPEAKLKRLIDEDDACAEDLAALGRRCGLSVDHLRLRFAAAYGMTPQAYRHQRRLAAAMDLIHGSDLAVKQIARRLGFRHTAGFSNWFRRRTGRTASAAMAEWRGA
jgi:AraC-like DNA-binding protein